MTTYANEQLQRELGALTVWACKSGDAPSHIQDRILRCVRLADVVAEPAYTRAQVVAVLAANMVSADGHSSLKTRAEAVVDALAR